jgi:hypothetical protein
MPARHEEQRTHAAIQSAPRKADGTDDVLARMGLGGERVFDLPAFHDLNQRPALRPLFIANHDQEPGVSPGIAIFIPCLDDPPLLAIVRKIGDAIHADRERNLLQVAEMFCHHRIMSRWFDAQA